MTAHVPQVSILLSVYNGEAYLAESIESLLAQTYRDFELVAVDDGSTDGTWGLLQSYAARDPRLVLLRNQPNEGVVQALNRGLQVVRGRYITRQDADDRSHPERIARQVSFLEAHPTYGLAGAVPRLVDLQGRPLHEAAYTATRDEEIQEKLLDHMCLCGPSVTIRKQTFEQAGFFFTEGLDASEDYDLCLRLAEKACVASLEGDLYDYRQHPASASLTRAAQQLFNKATALENAVHRRWGPAPELSRFANAGRDYLHAGVVAFVRGDLPFAARCLENALRVYPPLLSAGQPLEDLVRAYTPHTSLEESLQYTHTLFDTWLPRTARLQSMKRRLISYLYMAPIFAGQGTGRQAGPGLRRNLLAGVFYRPTWLFNRGVLALIWKHLLFPAAD